MSAATPNPDVPPTEESTNHKARQISVRWLIIGAAILAILIIGIIAVANLTAKSPFTSAVEDCGLKSSDDVQVGDGGNTLIVDGQGKESTGVAITTVACLMTSLEVPDSVIAQMDGTRALDGAQSAEFRGITVRWSYHPDNGLDLIFSR